MLPRRQRPLRRLRRRLGRPDVAVLPVGDGLCCCPVRECYGPLVLAQGGGRGQHEEEEEEQARGLREEEDEGLRGMKTF